MKTLISRALLLCAVFTVAGCGVSPFNMPVTVEAHSDVMRDAGSWMAVGAAQMKMLFYSSDSDNGVVHVYDYRTGHAIGRLANFSYPAGHCVDSRGDVFIANEGYGEVDMYTHGGMHPTKTFRANGSPVTCAVSPDHDLAVGNTHTPRGQGDVVIFKDAKGQRKGTSYKNKSCYHVASVAYDAHGNLYVQAATYHVKQVVCELPHNGTALRVVGVNVRLNDPRGMMWDGKHIAISDYSGGMIVYQMGETAKGGLVKVGKVVIGPNSCGGAANITQPFLLGSKNTPENRELATNFVGQAYECSNVDIWKYSTGGNPLRSFHGQGHPVAGQSVTIAP